MILQMEIQRTNISPKQFYSYCKRRAKMVGLNPENYLEFEDWKNPIAPCNDRNRHEDWDEPKLEICKHLPYEAQFYLKDSYNFIMEWDDGNGYLFIWENND